MVSVCRFCARWAEDVVGVDEILFYNLPHAKDAVKQMFDFDLSCEPAFPNQICPECVMFLQSCYFFREQLQKSENVFKKLQEQGKLAQRLSETKNAGDTLHLEEMLEEEPVSELPQDDAQENVESVDDNANGENLGGEMDAAVGEENNMATEPPERVVEISIEAIEELEITSNPIQSMPLSEGINAFVNGNQARAIAEPRPNISEEQGRVNASNHQTMLQAVPAGQKANGSVVRNKCYVCFTVYRTAAELMAHLLEHYDLLPYRCQSCSTDDWTIKFSTNQALNKHLEAHCNPFMCAKCHMRFSTKSARDDHILTAHLNKLLYDCKRCGIKFHELRKFRLHMANHRNMEMGLYQTANRTNERQNVVQQHSPRVYFQCAHCNCGFKYYANYKMHLKHHRQTKHLFRCTEMCCDTNFTTYREWRRHMKLHFPNGSLPFMFEILPASLQVPTAYPLACPEPNCAYVAPALPQMYSHFNIHLTRLQCPHCDKLYKNLSKLRSHVEQRHEGTRQMKC